MIRIKSSPVNDSCLGLCWSNSSRGTGSQQPILGDGATRGRRLETIDKVKQTNAAGDVDPGRATRGLLLEFLERACAVNASGLYGKAARLTRRGNHEAGYRVLEAALCSAEPATWPSECTVLRAPDMRDSLSKRPVQSGRFGTARREVLNRRPSGRRRIHFPMSPNVPPIGPRPGFHSWRQYPRSGPM